MEIDCAWIYEIPILQSIKSNTRVCFCFSDTLFEPSFQWPINRLIIKTHHDLWSLMEHLMSILNHLINGFRANVRCLALTDWLTDWSIDWCMTIVESRWLCMEDKKLYGIELFKLIRNDIIAKQSTVRYTNKYITWNICIDCNHSSDWKQSTVIP